MAETTFGRWIQLAEAATAAPRQPGVFQIKVPAGLLEYPSGKSAMVYYAAASDLRSDIGDFADAHAGEDWLCRHMVAPIELSKALIGTLLESFTTRFGGAPRLP